MFTPSQLAAFVQTEMISDQNTIQAQYTNDITDTIDQHWDQIRTSYEVDDDLIMNSIRFRMAFHAPQNAINYQPLRLGDHVTAIMFFLSVIHQFLGNVSFIANLYPCLILQSEDFVR